MKKFQSLILAILCSTSIALATTYTGTTGDCTYTLDFSDSTLVISGTGAMEDYSSYSSVPWYNYREYFNTVTIEDGVTSIGDYAFYKCTSLTNVTIGSGMTSIGSYAFQYCSSLTSITIPDGVTSIGSYAFYCTSLTSVTSLATTPPTCGYNPFSSSSSATLTAASNLYQYAEYRKDFSTIVYTNDAQTYETVLTGQCGDDLTYSLDLENGTIVIDGTGDMYDYSTFPYTPWYAFNAVITDITISAGVTSISDHAFFNCPSGLTVTSLATTPPTGNNVFPLDVDDGYTHGYLYVASLDYYCSDPWSLFNTIYYSGTGLCGDNLTYSFDSGTLTISGSGDMYDYTTADDVPWSCAAPYISEISIGDSVTSIGSYAFYNCLSLTSVTIPDGVTSIGSYAFGHCSSLTSVTSLATTPPTCSGNPFSSDTYEQATLYAASNMYKYTTYWKDFTTIEYTDDAQMYATTFIGQCGDNLIYTLDLEDGSVVIEGSGDMYDYDNYSSYAPWITYSDIIETFSLPSGMTSIGSYAFYYCSSLTSVTIPDGVTSINYRTFCNCKSLTSITIPNAVTYIGEQAFYNCSSLTSITIPDTVTYIDEKAFYNCTSLTSVISLATTPPICLGDPFSSDTYEQATLYPAFTDYATADYWSNFYNIVYIGGGSCGDDMKWYYCEGELIIFGSGDMYEYSSADEVPWAGFASEITSIIISSGVTSISDYAFYDCTNVTTVTSYDTTPPTVSENTFNSSTYSSAMLSVTSTSYVLADYWKQFSTKTTVDASEEEDYSVYDIFSDDDTGDDNTAVNIATASTSEIRAIGNAIVINTETAQTALVYNLSGQLVTKRAVSAGETSIGMSAGGVYVVALADGTKAKVLVK